MAPQQLAARATPDARTIAARAEVWNERADPSRTLDGCELGSGAERLELRRLGDADRERHRPGHRHRDRQGARRGVRIDQRSDARGVLVDALELLLHLV